MLETDSWVESSVAAGRHTRLPASVLGMLVADLYVVSGVPGVLAASMVPGLLVASVVLGLLVAPVVRNIPVVPDEPGLLVATVLLGLLLVASTVLVKALPVVTVLFEAATVSYNDKAFKFKFEF